MTAWSMPGGRVTSPYGMRKHPTTGARIEHTGADFAGSGDGGLFRAPASGRVIDKGSNPDTKRGYGNWIRVKADDGMIYLAAHLAEPARAAVGSRVLRGAVLGRRGATGAATGVHLHLSISKQYGSSYVDPVSYIRANELPATIPAGGSSARRYTVKRGDSLSAIGARLGIDWRTLYRLNAGRIGKDPDELKVGTVLNLPGGTNAPAPVRRTHTVRKGESLSAIAKRYGTTWQRLHAANRATIGSNANRIYAGLVLRIP